MARRNVLLLVAVLIAMLGTAMVFMYVRGIEARIKRDQDPVMVVAAKEHITAGESIAEAQAAGKIDQKDVRRVDAPKDALPDTRSIAGLVALTDIYPGEPLRQRDFGDPGSAGALATPQGNMALGIELADPARVGGFVRAGSEVAIFASADPVAIDGEGRKRELPARTTLVLERVTVLSVGETILGQRTTTDEGADAADDEAIPRTILTVSVDQADAEKLIYADRNGELTMALLTDEADPKVGPGVTADDVFPGAFGVAVTP